MYVKDSYIQKRMTKNFKSSSYEDKSLFHQAISNNVKFFHLGSVKYGGDGTSELLIEW